MMKKETYLKIIDSLSIITIGYLLVYATIALFTQRSLWIDEAMLAKCICVRDYASLWEGNLNYGQSSPIGYLLCAKFFCNILGESELALRLYGYLLTIGSAIMVYLISKYIFKAKLPLLIVAAYLSIPVIMVYMNEAKPYAADAFSSLMTFFLYWRYKENKTSLWIPCLWMSLSVWFCLGALFVMAGVCIYHCINIFIAYFRRNINLTFFVKKIIPIVFVGISVLLYYLIWIGPATKNIQEDAIEVWSKMSFPLVPRSKSDINLSYYLVSELLKIYYWLYRPIALLGIPYTILFNKKNWVNCSLGLAFIMVIMASSLGLYHIQARLQLALLSFVAIYAFFGLSQFIVNITFNKATSAVSIFLIILPLFATSGLRKNIFNQSNYYRPGEEYKECKKFINENIEGNAVEYVYFINKAFDDFYTKYKKESAIFDWDYEHTHVDGSTIYGNQIRELYSPTPGGLAYRPIDSRMNENARLIRQYPIVYIINAHPEGETVMQLLSKLEAMGSSIRKVYEYQNTPVYKIYN